MKHCLSCLIHYFERFSILERLINSLQTGLSTLSEKSRIILEKTNYVEKAMEFENAEIEELKKKDKENEDKIKKLEDKLLYQEVYNRRENLRFFGIPESTSGAKNTFEVVRKFLKEELDLENAENIEFQRACSHESYIFSFCCLVAFLVCFVPIVIGKFLLYIFVQFLKCKLIFSYRVLFVT